MAIVFDNATKGTTSTFSHTTSGSQRLLVVGVFWNTADGTFTGLTYNGVALTQALTKQVGAGTQYVDIWYLANPASGANNVVFSGTNTGKIMIASSYTGVAQTSPLDTTNNASATSATSVGGSITTGVDNALVVAEVRGDAGDVKSNSGGVAGTNRTADTQRLYWDSNGGVGTAGAKTVAYSAAGTQNWGLAIASFKPYGKKKNLTLLGVG